MTLHSKKATRRHVMALGAAALTAPAIRSAHAQAKTLVFGGSVPLSGAAAETGLNVNNGYITAVNYINDVLGGVEIAGEKYKIELKLFDDASDPARATTLIQRQIDEGTDFFLGSFGTNIVLPTAAITERAEEADGADRRRLGRDLHQGLQVHLRHVPARHPPVRLGRGAVQVAPAHAADLFGDLHQRRLLQDRGRGRAAVCDAAGFKRLDSFELPAKPTDVSSVLGSVRANTPDILVCVMHDQNSLLIARQMVASNTNVKLLFQGLGPQLASFREALGKYSEALLCSTYWDENVPYKDKFFGDSEEVRRVLQGQVHPADRLSHGRRRGLHRDLYLAMQAAKSIKPEAVRDALAEADYETFYGRIKFTPEGDGDAITAWAA